jgi:hypothetical protein
MSSIFFEVDFHIHLESTTISHRGCSSCEENRAQRRASPGQCRQILVLVIGYAIFPAAKYDANPFEGQGSHRSVVVVAPLPLLLVIGAGVALYLNRDHKKAGGQAAAVPSSVCRV